MRQKKIAWIAFGAVFCLTACQAALAPSLAALLRRTLARQAVEYTALTVRVAPLTWFDLLRGHLGQVEITARHISFGGPRLALLTMKLENIGLAPGAMLLRGRAEIAALGPSVLRARVEASALNAYRAWAYPSVAVWFRIRRDRIGLAGSLTILGHEVPVRTDGRLCAVGGDRLRYVPLAVEVAGARVPVAWLASYGERLAVEFPLVLPLPVTLSQIRLQEGYIELIWVERQSPGLHSGIAGSRMHNRRSMARRLPRNVSRQRVKYSEFSADPRQLAAPACAPSMSML